jgi:hypothetical protein
MLPGAHEQGRGLGGGVGAGQIVDDLLKLRERRLADVGRRGAAREFERLGLGLGVVARCGRFGLAVDEHLVELLPGDAELLSELPSVPWLRLGLSGFPPADRGAVDADAVREVLLRDSGSLARSHEPRTSPRHASEPTQVSGGGCGMDAASLVTPAASARW